MQLSQHLRRLALTLTTVACLALMVGCGSQAGTDTNSKTLTFASTDYTTINPILNTHDELPDIIFSGLMKYNGHGEPVPDLATDYQFDEATLTYTFHLRKGVTWHDGTPFTAADVKFTLDQLTKNTKLEASIRDNYKEIKDVIVVDDNTVQIVLSQPNAAMLNYLTIGLLPKHLLEGKDIMTDDFNRHPIGTGRYKFVSWDKGQSIVVSKNETYYDQVPHIDKIIFKIILDENAKATQVKSGGVDIAWLNAHNTEAFRGNDKFTVYDFKTADYRGIAPNFDNAFWKKHPELVSILGYAIDKKAIIASVLNNQGSVAYSPLQQNATYNDPTVPHRDYNPTYVKDALAQAGWHRGTDGIYEKNGEKLAFSVDVREYETERVDMAKVIASQLKEEGIDMRVHIVSKFDWKHNQAIMIGQAAPFDPDNGTYDLFYTNGSGNYTHYSNAAVDAALAKARATYDPAQRKLAYDEFQQAFAAHPAYIMIAYLDGNYVAAKKITGPSTERVLGHHATGVMWNIETWDIQQ